MSPPRALSPRFWPWRLAAALVAPRLALFALTRIVPLPGDELRRVLEERILSAVVSFAVLFAVVRLMERRTLRDTGLFDPVHWARRFSVGLGLGAGPVAAQAAAMAAVGLYAFSWPGEATIAEAAFLAAVLLLAGLDEEIRFRALAFRTLDEGAGSWLAMALSAAFFGLAHAGNRGATPLGIAAIAAGGVFLAACYLRYRSLWIPIGFHFAWNTTMGVVLGLPISGTQVPSLLHAKVLGPEPWTGGPFGPEAGAVLTAFLVLAACFAVWRVAAEGKMHTPPWVDRLWALARGRRGRQPSSMGTNMRAPPR